MDIQSWTYAFVGLTFGTYLFIAWRSRVRDTRGFYVAGRDVPAMANGMATAADWMSAASFISMAGLISTMGFVGGQYLMGWTGGYVLLALLLAPYLRKFGHYTVPDFVGDRYESNIARLVAVLCAIFVSFTYVAGQMRGVGIVFSRFLEVDITVGVVIGMVIVFIYATLGGMKGITWTQVAQYWVLITAFLIPAIAISFKLTGNPLPQIGMGSSLGDGGGHLLGKLNDINGDLGFSSYTEAFGYGTEESRSKLLNMFCVTLALMAGTAGLPHVIVRFYTVKSVKAARWSAFWALFFISLLYLTAPATAAFARYYLIDSIQDKTFRVEGVEAPDEVLSSGGSRFEVGDAVYYVVEEGLVEEGLIEKGDGADDKPFVSELPGWFHNWSRTGLILWLDDGDGRLRYSKGDDNEVFNRGKLPEHLVWGDLETAHAAWVSWRRGGEQGPVRGADARKVLRDNVGSGVDYPKLSGPDRDIIVLAMPEMAELYDWIIALMAAGGLAAALSTASGLLLVISSSVAHDLYYRVINPEATEKKRLFVGRVVIGLAIVVAGLLGIFPPDFVGKVVAFAFGLAAASFFPAIVLGIFSKRVGTVPAVTGMVVGIAFTAYYIVGTVFWKMEPWCLGIGPQGIGSVGMLLNFAVTLALTPIFPAPSDRVQRMVESIREPEEN